MATKRIPNFDPFEADDGDPMRFGSEPTPPPAAPTAAKVTTKNSIPGFEDMRAATMAEAVEPMMARYKLAADFPGAVLEPTGVGELDKYVPVAPGRLIVVGGREGSGKSAFMLQVARYVSHRGPVLYLLTEMTLEEVVTRIVSNVSHVPMWKLEKGANPELLDQARETLEWLAEHTNLTIVEAQGANAKELCERTKKWAAAQPAAPRAVFVDNLWGVAQAKGAGLGDSSGIVSIRLGNIAQQFADLTKPDTGVDCPVFLAHHLNREGASQSKTPETSNLGGSDHIGYWASTVLLLQKRAVEDLDGTHDMVVSKNRSGKNGLKVPLRFVGEQMRFEGSIGGAQPFETPPVETDKDRQFREAFKELPDW